MGGQNHQPTNRVRLIAPSAWLSQCVGDGFIEVLSANSALEKAIIVGMDRLHVENTVAPLEGSAAEYLRGAIDHLEASLDMVSAIEAGFAGLLAAAAAENYHGNPLASQVASYGFAEKFEGGLIVPTINRAAWSEIESHIAEENILKTLAWEATRFAALRNPTTSLIEVLEQCYALAKTEGARTMVEAIECNEVPLRQRFAPVFSLWNHLHAMFLYSALMMTELFYLTNSLGTLTDEKRSDTAVSA